MTLLALAGLFFFISLGSFDLTNPDEVFYAQTAKEMAAGNSWMTPYMFGQPQFEKPILTYWLIRIGYLLFGVNAFGARFFCALFATAGVLGVYFLGLLGFRDERKAFLSALVCMSAIFYMALARTVFTDMFFTVFIALSLTAFYWAYACPERKRPGILLFFVFSGLAVLTKGPLGAAIPFAAALAFVLLMRMPGFLLDPVFAAGLALCAAISVPWYAFIIGRHGDAFIREFFYNDHYRRLIYAEHRSNDRWYFYPLTMIGCMFPWSAFTAAALGRLFKRIGEAKPFTLFCACWIITVLAAFQFAHSKLTTYILPLFPALAVVTADFISGNASSRLLKNCFLITLAVCAVIPVVLVAGITVFSGYLSSATPAYILILATGVFAWIFFSFIRRDKLSKAAYALAGFNLIIILALPFASRDVDRLASSREAGKCLNANGARGTVLCSKPFVRGVSYFSGLDTAFFDTGTFFSPHPVTYLSPADPPAVRAFLVRQGITYCVLRSSGARQMKEIAGTDFRVEQLCVVGEQHVIKVSPST